MSDKKRGIGFLYAWNGVLEIIKTERNFRIHLTCALLVVLFGLALRLTSLEWAAIILVIGFVLMAELFNSVIEKLIDYLKPEIHPAAKVIKDAAAGGVLIAAITAVIIGALIFIPKLIQLLP